jgi:mono/diheme cytochrome c family protein
VPGADPGANGNMTRFRAAVLLSAFAMTGHAGAASAGEADEVTFNKHVAPILFRKCAGCHRPGEVAPFSLLGHGDASKRAGLIAELTSTREMPPWKAEPGAGHFADERRLSDDEVATIRRWSEAGAPEGDAADLPSAPHFTEGWQLGEPDLVLRMAEPYALAASGPDEYRCFVLPIRVPSGKYIKAIEYRPGNRKVVHHAVFTSMSHEQALAKLAEGDGKSFLSGLAPPGRLLSGPLSIWTPGMEPHELPGGLAASWPGASDLVMQLHLHPSGKPELEQSTLGIHLTDREPSARLVLSTVSNNKIDIEPGRPDYEIRASRTLNAETTLFGVFPHLHLIGRSVRAEATLPDATRVPLISIADWDFNWQYYYRYAEPVRLPAGTRIDVRWTYDNSAANPANPSKPPRRVTFGDQTVDEMAFLVFDQIATGPTPTGRLPTQR